MADIRPEQRPTVPTTGEATPSAGSEWFAALAAEVLTRPPRLGDTRLVCVDGPSAAGKTVFAERLAVAFRRAVAPHPVPVVHTDDLLAGWDDQFTFWPRLRRLVLAPLRAGRSGRYQAYDWHRGEFAGPLIEVPPAPVVVLEGVSSARAEARRDATLTVFVTAASALRLARSAVRDGEEQRLYLETWRQREDQHFLADDTARHADLIVDTDMWP